MKLGLNLLYLEQGPQSALAPDLDDVRDAIRGAPYRGFLLIGPLDITRRPDLTGKVRNGFAGIELAARLQYGGLDLTAPLFWDRRRARRPRGRAATATTS